jgi:hypothetical protein
MEGAVRDMREVYSAVLSWNYCRGTEEDQDDSQVNLGTSIYRTEKIQNTRQQ